ncbi:Arylformamidase [Burkholderiales bacterium 8X]|nr:Arylformamidase [Burkholderiales bacterium 8X]
MVSYDPAWLDRMYNNRALVPDHADYFARWASESAKTRDLLNCKLDLHYAPAPNETLDVFRGSARRAPVLFFIHGGWWRALDKSDHSFVARHFTREGFCVVVPNYSLCPGTPEQPVSIADIALEMVRALVWTFRHVHAHGGDPNRITVAGHSAGGHLAAMLLGCDWKSVASDLPPNLVRNAMSLSGLHDLHPIRRVSFLKDSLRLGEADASMLSPALWPAPEAGPLYALAGADESEEFIRQNNLIREAWGPEKVPVCETVPGCHHFSIVDALADPGHALHGRLLELLRA